MFSSSEMQADNLVITNFAAKGVDLNTHANSDALQAEGNVAHSIKKRDVMYMAATPMKVMKPMPSKKQSKAMFEMSSVAKSFMV